MRWQRPQGVAWDAVPEQSCLHPILMSRLAAEEVTRMTQMTFDCRGPSS